MVSTNDSFGISGKLRDLSAAMDKMAHEFQAKEVEVEKINASLREAETMAKSKQDEIKREAAQETAKIQDDLKKVEALAKNKEEQVKRESEQATAKLQTNLKKAEDDLAKIKAESEKQH